jgi:hypothetical protein
MPSGYSLLFFAQQVLPNGQIIINDGEYNASGNACGSGVWTNGGVPYDSLANS